MGIIPRALTLKFASLPWRPTETCDGRVLSRLSTMQRGSSLRAFLKAPLRTDKSPEPLTAEFYGSRDVTEEWRSYRALHRKR